MFNPVVWEDDNPFLYAGMFKVKNVVRKRNKSCLSRYILLISRLLVLMIQFLSLNSFSQNLATDFNEIKASLIKHPVFNKFDSLSVPEIIEFRDDQGYPKRFSREIIKNVCLTHECRMVHLNIYWNAAGNYQKIEIRENEPLTKTDHSVFSEDDYRKLDRILSDSLSVLRDLKIEDLVIENKDTNNVDGYSGSTKPSLYESVIRNAVYTCYTLWHAVYSSDRDEILSFIEQRTDSQYIRQIFDRQDPQFLSWAIDFINKHQEYHAAFYPDIMNLVKSEDKIISLKALHYFNPLRLSKSEIQKGLTMVIKEASPQMKFEIIWAFSGVTKVSDEAILIMLDQYEDQEISAGLLSYVCKLIRSENMEDNRIAKKLKHLSVDKNLYVRNMMQKILERTNQNN